MKNNIFNGKAQVALEFLTTYGWALLAIIAVIGVLSYFGFSDINNKIPSTCNFGTGFSCDNYVGVADGSYAFELKNMQRTAINVTQLYCDFGDLNHTFNGFSKVVGVGEKVIFYCNSSAAGVTDSFTGKNKFLAKVYYHLDEDGALPKVVSGDIIVPASSSETVIDSYVSSAIN